MKIAYQNNYFDNNVAFYNFLFQREKEAAFNKALKMNLVVKRVCKKILLFVC